MVNNRWINVFDPGLVLFELVDHMMFQSPADRTLVGLLLDKAVENKAAAAEIVSKLSSLVCVRVYPEAIGLEHAVTFFVMMKVIFADCGLDSQPPAHDIFRQFPSTCEGPLHFSQETFGFVLLFLQTGSYHLVVKVWIFG